MTPADVKVAQKLPFLTLTAMVVGSMVGAGVVYSRYAQRREDIGRATVLGLLSVVALFTSVTLLSYGALPKSELEQLRQQSMMGVLESVVGPWGSVFIGIGLIVSVLGAYLAWTVMAAEVVRRRGGQRHAADPATGERPRRANRLTRDVQCADLRSPAGHALLPGRLHLHLHPQALHLGVADSLPAGGRVRVADRGRGETYEHAPQDRRKELVYAALATIYTAFLLVAAGPEFVLLSFIIYAPGTILFVMTRREQGRRTFSPAELVLFVLAVVLAVLGIVGLATGLIVI